MKTIVIRYIFFTLCLVFWIHESLAADELQAPQDILLFEVVQDSFVFDNITVKDASLVENEGVFRGLQIEIKKSSRDTFQRLVKSGIGKRVQIVLNKNIVTSTVVQSSLGNNLLITGLTRGEAQGFINTLKANQEKNRSLSAQE